MDELVLFSCRNCIHNASQSPNIGPGSGFCLRYKSVICEPLTATCKYLHRKDLPSFVVDEGIREHASEFATFPGIANLITKKPIAGIPYSEKFAWERGTFDPVTHAIAQYRKAGKSWIFIESIAAGIDGRRSIAYASLVRRYIDTCDTWTSSYRLFLGFVQEIDSTPIFEDKNLFLQLPGETPQEVREPALWDVIFSRISALQEYGWHAGLEDLMWATDSLNGALSEFNWDLLKKDLATKRQSWTERIIEHARKEGVFFPPDNEETEEADRDD
jgi:hypothetical protein